MLKTPFVALLLGAFLFISIPFNANAQNWKQVNAAAIALFNKGSLDSAVLVGEKALIKASEEFGKGHINYVIELINLGFYNEFSGKRLVAEPLYLEALKITRNAGGKMDDQLYRALNSLGLLYQSQEKFSLIEPLLTEALALQEKIGGKETIDYAGAANNLAVFYHSQNNLDKAEPLYLVAAALYKKLQGATHANYATVIDNLGAIFAARGSFAKSENYIREALEIRKKTLGTEHLQYAISLIRLGDLYKNNGNYAQAEPLYTDAINIRKRVLGTRHPDYLLAVNSLSEMFRLAGMPEKAIPLLELFITEGKDIFPPQDPGYLKSKQQLTALKNKLAAAPKKSTEPRLVLPIGHLSTVNKTKFSPNGKYILTASDDGTLKLWDVLTGKLLNTYEGHTSYVKDIAFNKDGSLIASGSSDSTARVWETVSGKLLRTFSGHKDDVNSVAFDNNSNFLLTGSSWNNVVAIWDLTTGLNKELVQFGEGMSEVSYTADSKGILLTLKDHTVRSCITEKDSVVCKDYIGHNKVVTAAIMFADMRQMITASADSTLIVWDAASAKILKKVKLDFPIGALALSSDESKLFINAFRTPYAELRSMHDLAPYLHWGENKSGYGNSISGAFSGNSKYLFIALSETKGALVYSLQDSVKLFTKVDLQEASSIADVNFSSDGTKLILSEAAKSEPEVWNPLTNTLLTRLAGHTSHTNYLQTVLNDNYSLIGSYKNKAELWDNQTMRPVYNLNDKLKNISGIYMSPSNHFFATNDWNNQLQLWDTKTGKLLYEIACGLEKGGSNVVMPLWAEDNTPVMPAKINNGFHAKKTFETGVFSPDETFFASASAQEDGAALWDLKTKQLKVSFNIGAAGVFSLAFSPDGNQLAATGRSGATVILNTRDNQLTALKGHSANVHSILFNKAGTRLLTAGADSTVRLWDAGNGQLIKSIKTGGPNYYANFSSDEKKILVISGKSFKVYDASSYSQLFDTPTAASKFTLMNDPARVMLWGSYASLPPYIFNIATFKTEKQYPAEMRGIIALSKDNLTITSTGDNKTIRWNAVTGKPIVTFFTVDSADFLSQTPEKYYSSSANGAKLLHYVTPDLKVVSFEQLDVKYNRPDKVLQAIGSKDVELIKSYKKAYEKRIKKLGIDTLAFRAGNSMPTADFADRDRINKEQHKGQLSLRITGSDKDFPLEQFNVWVNENPLFGMRGISLKGKRRNNLDTTITINLSDGENRIETSVRNQNGIESYRIPLQVKYLPGTPAPDKRYFIGIGINNFAQSGYNLKWSVKDIRDQARALGKKFGAAISIDTLFDAQVTVKNIIALRKKLLETGVNDKVILAYSGHGLLSKDFDYFLSTYDVNFQDPADKGLPYEVLESLLDSIPARKKLVLIDACHSGEVDKEEMLRLKNAQTGLAANKVSGSKGITDVVMDEGKIGMKNSFELMQELFVNVGRSTGATIISAAGGMQYALETNKLKNGVFSYSILEFMEAHPTAKVSEIKNYVNKRVTELTSGMQVPTTRSEASAIDWEVW